MGRDRLFPAARSSTPPTPLARRRCFSANLWLLGGIVLFFMVLRPLAFGASSASNAIAVRAEPDAACPVAAAPLDHGAGRDILRQRFCHGRIAQKQMQTARAVTDVATEFINTVCFALASLVGSAIFLLAIDFLGRGVAVGLDAAALCRPHPLLHSACPQEFGGAGGRYGRWCRGRSSTRLPTSRRSSFSPMPNTRTRAALSAMRTFRERAGIRGDIGVVPAFADDTCRIAAGDLVGGTLVMWTHERQRGHRRLGRHCNRIAQMTGCGSVSPSWRSTPISARSRTECAR